MNFDEYILKDKENEKKYDIKLSKLVVCVKVYCGCFLWLVVVYCIDKICNGLESYWVVVEVNGVIFKMYWV